MKCDKVKEMLSDYHNGFLSTREKESIEEHLKECSSCKHELESLESLTKLLRDEGRVEAPEGYWDNDWDRLASALPKDEPKIPPWYLQWGRAFLQDSRLAMASITLGIFAIAICALRFIPGEIQNDSSGGRTGQMRLYAIEDEGKTEQKQPEIPKVVQNVILVKPLETQLITLTEKPVTAVYQTNIMNVEIATPSAPSEGIDLAIGPEETAVPAGTGTIYPDGILHSEGHATGPAVNPNVGMTTAIRVGKKETRQVRIVLAQHDFTNYQKHEDTLKNLFGNVDLVALADIANSDTTAVFMTGDDLDEAKKKGLLRQGLKVAEKKKSFTSAEQNALRRYVENGGVFIFNSGEGSVFREKIRRELINLFGNMGPIETNRKIKAGQLFGIQVNGRSAVIFSEYDLLGQREQSEVYSFLIDILFQQLHRK